MTMKRNRILVVDDQAVWLKTIELILGSRYELEVTTEPSEAVALAESLDFALAILDQRLPGEITGIDLLEQLQKIQPELPGIILTGHASLEDAMKSMKVASGYISKSRHDLAEALQSRVETVLQNSIPGEDVKKGDTVLIGKYSGTDIKLDDVEYTILREDEVFAVVERGNQETGSSPPSSENRYLEGQFPRQVRLGTSPSLEARIALKAPSPDAFLSRLRPFAIPDEGVMVKLSVHCSSAFRVTPALHEVKVRRGVDSDWVAFAVEALQPGVHWLEIIAYVDGVQAGALKIESAIREFEATTQPQSTTQDVELQRRPRGDATLEITYDASANAYHYKWITFDGWLASDEITHPLKVIPKERIGKLLSTINDIARQRLSLSRDAAGTLLKGEAIQLWLELIPKELEEEFFSRRATTKRLMLRPRYDAIPWELLCSPDTDAGFLAEQFIVSRWSSAQELRKVIDITRGETVVPPRSPARALEEISDITDILQPRTSLGKPIDNLDILLRRLSKAEFQLLHFACHHSYSSASGINFDGALFTPAFLNVNHFSEPLVFINACRADNKEATFTGVSSWADKFIECGAAAFVGTLWDVRDEPAREFAKTFYTLIAGGTSLGDAVLQARTKIRDPSDPTWLAYTLYADPGAVVRR